MKRRIALRWLVVATITYLAVLPFEWFASIFSPMLSDGGRSPLVYTQVYSLMISPYLLVGATMVAWVLFAAKQEPWAMSTLAIPLLDGLVIFFVIVLPGALQ